MYKDKDKQRETQKERQRRYRRDANLRRDKQGVTIVDESQSVMIPVHPAIPKRGKDIKTFEDLSPSIQQTIDKMAMVDGKIDKSIKANRTAIAVNYQHLFPGRPYTGV